MRFQLAGMYQKLPILSPIIIVSCVCVYCVIETNERRKFISIEDDLATK